MSISENLHAIKKEIGNNVNLIAVSKTKPIEDIDKAYNLGIRDFGENKVQELVEKIDKFQKEDIRWHLIGHLQRNKVKYIIGKVYLIHSLDSIRLLKEIERKYKDEDKVAKVLIQINIGEDENKYGIKVEELEDMIKACEECSNVKIEGLMTILPMEDSEICKKYFKQMKKIFDDLKNRSFKNIEMKYLSMGMSGDYKIAIEEGSNMIRVGQGIFGKRDYNNL
ncbi:YggS family pyridoxal phosphate enzyme [Clostridium tetani]|uniref:YggS family pyridoxal phosphate-dependent enzyme n=1 Tax=Clostridium tetani TaxID=1513 RepID=UPI000D217218|nr:YggS family pyridoxal phosphate-dependent enzyme [Clostridium tetani]AVP54163.1 YggS family pyridoxal phosphate-dependent enzyme [Clostridium tetani]RXI51065.1 YggS family pyridoxal phosphate-dependent enzyme [Clostridium tetani]RXI51075.1 YggS family pyridoxal phosphate-dependent enzyme [Clostridium tetani]RXI76312.1 YggS family pyridoxal phosphate-dependent enzyme [Clostridium tetani]RXM68212.1 YggS family pyridoxal phosphate-dependent enzyme [Clostridium tetani]